MAKDFAKAFYNSSKWKRCRNAYIAKRIAVDGGMCETCREAVGYIVHHVIELTPENINDPDISLNHFNLKYDCHICHQKEGKNPDMAAGLVRYEFTEDGDIRLPPV